MKKTNIMITGTCMLACLAIPVRAEPTDQPQTKTLTERRALELALKHNPLYKAEQLDLAIASANERQARLWSNPELNFSVEEFSGSETRKDFDAAETTVTLSKEIDLSGRKRNAAKLKSKETAAAENKIETSRVETIRDTVKAFVSLLAAQEYLALADSQVLLAAGSLDAVSNRVNAGKDSPLAELNAEIEVARAQLEQNSASAELDNRRRKMAALWGSTSPEFTNAEGRLDITGTLPSLDKIRNIARNSPHLKALQTELDISEAGIAVARAEGRIDMNIEAGIKRLEEDDENVWVAGVSIPLPLFNRNQGGRKEAGHSFDRTRLSTDHAAIIFHTRLATAYNHLKAAMSNSELLDRKIMKNAVTAYESALLGYRNGKHNYIQVLEAQKLSFESKKQLINELAKARFILAELEELIGQPLEMQ